MGEITVDVTLENPIDRGVFERGSGEEVDIRRTSIKATVDTGLVMLILPQIVFRRSPSVPRPTASNDTHRTGKPRSETSSAPFWSQRQPSENPGVV